MIICSIISPSSYYNVYFFNCIDYFFLNRTHNAYAFDEKISSVWDVCLYVTRSVRRIGTSTRSFFKHHIFFISSDISVGLVLFKFYIVHKRTNGMMRNCFSLRVRAKILSIRRVLRLWEGKNTITCLKLTRVPCFDSTSCLLKSCWLQLFTIG